MMFSNKMVCCLKANGKILREFKDTTYIPFGSEYSILLKNLNSLRASVKVSIDGTDVAEGINFIIGPNSDFELTRFIKNGNKNSGNKFKFIERTAQIEEYKGIGIEDGLIRIEFQFEKVYQSITVQPSWNHSPIYGGSLLSRSRDEGANTIQCGIANNDSSLYSAMDIVQCVAAPLTNDVGITVAGSISTQQFQTIVNFSLEPEKYVMVLKLLGETTQGQLITQAVTVKTKSTCITCGTVNKALAKFCHNCGTSLIDLSSTQ